MTKNAVSLRLVVRLADSKDWKRAKGQPRTSGLASVRLHTRPTKPTGFGAAGARSPFRLRPSPSSSVLSTPPELCRSHRPPQNCLPGLPGIGAALALQPALTLRIARILSPWPRILKRPTPRALFVDSKLQAAYSGTRYSPPSVAYIPTSAPQGEPVSST